MAGEFTKPSSMYVAQVGKIASPSGINQNFAAIAKDSIQGIDVDGLYSDFDIGDETNGTVGALASDIKMRNGGAIKLYNSSGVLVTTITLNQVGAVTPFAMTTAPTGWLECNGSAISRTTYADLFSAIGTTFGVGNGSTTFNIPDLRGYFVRGWANGGSVDSGRSFGSTQTDAFQGHYHNMLCNNANGAAGNGASYTSQATTNTRTDLTTAAVTDGTNGTPRTSTETRPTNLALMYCIKY